MLCSHWAEPSSRRLLLENLFFLEASLVTKCSSESSSALWNYSCVFVVVVFGFVNLRRQRCCRQMVTWCVCQSRYLCLIHNHSLIHSLSLRLLLFLPHVYLSFQSGSPRRLFVCSQSLMFLCDGWFRLTERLHMNDTNQHSCSDGETICPLLPPQKRKKTSNRKCSTHHGCCIVEPWCATRQQRQSLSPTVKDEPLSDWAGNEPQFHDGIFLNKSDIPKNCDKE